MSPSPRSRGFTLIELLVGTVVGSIVLLGISMTFISQAQQYQSHASRRAIQSSARQSLAFMERRVRSAGYGVNPDRAVLAYDSYNVVADDSQPGFPDAIVVHSRDPLFRRKLEGATPTELTLSPAGPALTQPLPRGQILLLLCNLATEYAFVTVSEPAAAGDTTIKLDQNPPDADSPVSGPGTLFREHGRLTNGCFDEAALVRIDRSAFYVAMFDEDGDLTTAGRVPYLMLHQGVDLTGDGAINANDAVPVAEGIEQLQVAYVLNANNPDAPDAAPIILGVTAPMPDSHYGEGWQASNGMINLFSSEKHPTTPWYFNTEEVLTDSELRRQDHPANIRQIRLTVAARSTVPDQQIIGDNLMTGAAGAPLAVNGVIPWQQLENLDMPPAADFTPSGGRYYRVLLRESITPKNLLMNAQFPPVEFLDRDLINTPNVPRPGGG